MPILGKLKALNVVREKRPSLYGDGGRLYLQVTKRGAKSWSSAFGLPSAMRQPVELIRDPTTNKVKGKAREMGLYSFTPRSTHFDLLRSCDA